MRVAINACLIGFISVPIDVPSVMITYQHTPLTHWHFASAFPKITVFVNILLLSCLAIIAVQISGLTERRKA